MIRDIIKNIKLSIFRLKWRNANKLNYTVPNNKFKPSLVKVGDYTYGPLNVQTWNSENENLHIGSFCCIANNVFFLLGGEHDYSNITTYPFKAKFRGEIEAKSKGIISIGDFVWIGAPPSSPG